MIKVYITGSKGEIGKQIYSYLIRKKNIFVVPIVREKKTDYKHYLYWDYFKSKASYKIKKSKCSNTQTFLIHCGYDFSDKKIIDNSNYKAVKNLYSYFDKIINISTMSAYEGCFSIYGKNKLAIEKIIEINHGFNLRMGVPVAPKNKKNIGFINAQNKINNIFPFITFGIDTKNDDSIFITHLSVFNNAIYRILKNEVYPGTYSIVNKNPIKIINFLKIHTSKIIIKIDWRLIYLCFKALEFLGLKLRFGSDSVIGLVKSTKIIEKPILKK